MTTHDRLFAILFLLTGIFAFASGLSTWGQGLIFFQTDLMPAWIPVSDLLLTGPLSLATAVGLWNARPWGRLLGLVTSGVYLLGSVLVEIQVLWQGPPYAWTWAVIALFGLALAVAYLVVMVRASTS